MPNPDKIKEIFTKLVQGEVVNDSEISILKEAIDSSNKQSFQFGKYSVNIGQGEGIKIGNQYIYQGNGSETILEALKKALQEFFASQDSSNLPLIDWRKVCSQLLTQQQKNQRLRRKATELGFELNVDVPLGLVERRQQQRRSASDDVGREEVYQLSEEVITKEYEHDAFLNEVIGVNSADNKHVAIVGEPGAGKTTLLTKIADWIDKNEKGLPIYISLANLQTKSLENYLLEVWLEEALNFIAPEARVYQDAVKESLKERFRAGGVWLLLDGLDEMAVSLSTGALATIQSQLSGWVAQARVALTSRLNVWDFRLNNPLANFETYRTLEFSQEDVEQFIKDWFAPKNANNELLGTQLQAKLEESQYQRVRELVKNPLRLALLCQTWYYNQGKLPQTRAGLYQRFVQDFYREWKSELNQITETEKQELNQALGKLALAGINSQTRFRLGTQLAIQEMGEPLFNSACERGWLNLVDRDADTNDDPVYAFFHPSFQEYFAAKHIYDNPKLIEQTVTHINDKGWREVFLLLAELPEPEQADEKLSADDLLSEMEKQIQTYPNTRKLKSLLAWAEQITDTSETDIKPVGKRAIALVHASTLAYSYTLVHASSIAHTYAPATPTPILWPTISSTHMLTPTPMPIFTPRL
ncbi:MAG: NACHT domain-containing protein [Xenococcaceae cyanobacterium MO_188.B32]|nr:NACHT domain-containing protein [Xenococcaceae cyanobacterium MO_188.B32]